MHPFIIGSLFLLGFAVWVLFVTMAIQFYIGYYFGRWSGHYTNDHSGLLGRAYDWGFDFGRWRKRKNPFRIEPSERRLERNKIRRYLRGKHDVY